ncbi:Rubredoxin [Pandoraea pulmonicola]|uniref:Rubredoxin n=2 Tax=Pandoraea pulmonicola TaxID=93221 RepID=A0AAJ5D1P5_PANPU|nr:Rubredoxin [Pandoraea pulmonicola]
MHREHDARVPNIVSDPDLSGVILVRTAGVIIVASCGTMSPRFLDLLHATAPIQCSARAAASCGGRYSFISAFRMYKKGSAVELQFSPSRLNDGAGDPFWIDLTRDEAQALLAALQTHLNTPRRDASGTESPLVFTLLDPGAPSGVVASAAQDEKRSSAAGAEVASRQWVCVICGWIYDEAAGYPEDGIAPGTRWEDVPADWRCPLCDVGKEDFAMVEF